jgi:hypothetical protein
VSLKNIEPDKNPMKYLRFQMTKSTFYWNASIYVEFTYKPFLFILINSRYIENTQLSEINQIIAYIKVIYATSRAFRAFVKSESRKIWPPTIKKGKSMYQIYPYKVVITK